MTKATVTITFDNHNKKQSPLGYESYDEITVSRQVSVLLLVVVVVQGTDDKLV